MSDDVPVICRLDAHEMRGYAAACLLSAEWIEQLAGRLRSASSIDAAIIGLEQLQQRFDEQAEFAKVMIARAEAEDREAAEDGEANAEGGETAAHHGRHGAACYTQDRLDRLAELWPTSMKREDILRELNAMPGPKIVNANALDQKARKLGLRRKATDVPAEAAGVSLHAGGVLDPAKPLPVILPDVGFPAGMLPPVPAMEPLSAEDEAEARTMLASGQHGAQSLAEYFGGPLTWWQHWCAQQRAAS